MATSEKDIASLTIKEVLLENFDFEQTTDMFDGNPTYHHTKHDILLITSKRDLIHTNHLEEQFSAEVFIFCSRHRSESAKPALLVHSTGNLGTEALFGGEPSSLSISCGSLVAIGLRTLYEQRNSRGLDEFDVSMEATHHGPTSMNTPLLFIELGSDEEYWTHEEGGECVAAAAMACGTSPIQEETYIGFGGTHYVSKFNSLVLHNDITLGHMAAKYALDSITRDVVKLMVSRCKEKVERAIIDWKGTNSAQREHLIPILDDLGIELVRARHI